MKVRLPIERQMKQSKREAFEIATEEKARKMFKEYDSYAIDIVIVSAVLALIEQFGWGSGKRATRIPRFIAAVEKTLQEACDRYDHAFAMTALQKRLDNYGITYERKSEK